MKPVIVTSQRDYTKTFRNVFSRIDSGSRKAEEQIIDSWCIKMIVEPSWAKNLFKLEAG